MACSAESFDLDADVNYEDWGTMDGCYEDSGDIRADLPVYFINGAIEDDTFAVWASESYDTTIPAIWVLGRYQNDDDGYIRTCIDADETDASTIHPADVDQWNCWSDDLGDGSFVREDYVTVECGCGETPAPVTPPTPAPVTPPTPAPATPVVVEPPSASSSSSSVSLGAVIGGSVGGAALLLIAGVFLVKRRRDSKGNGGPGAPGAGNAPAANAPAALGGGKNYPVVSEFGGRNYPIVSGDGV